jgi:3-deoxy-D-manno-octulosonic-acid transferase
VGARPVLLAASTHPGEEEIALEAYQGIASDRADLGVVLVIVPRHPIRGRGIADRAREMGFATVLQSELAGGQETPRAEVWVADALGELGGWFRLANSALVGGSLAPGIGGHNPLEPARLACPIVVGPHVENWASVYAMLQEANAVVEVSDAESLDRAWRMDVERFREARERGRRAFKAAEAGAGDLDRAVERLLELVR